MEIQPKLTRCSNGHWYNAALHDSCPYCSDSSSAMPETIAPDAGGSFPQTAPPESTSSTPFTATTPISVERDSASAASPFAPTTFGGNLAGGDSSVEPVVGWLVCLSGPMRGTDFRLHSGNNYIGREVGDIHIHGDQQISRERDTIIAFSSAKLRYYVRPDSGRNLIELNGEPVLAPMELHSHDILTIGTTKLMFIPLCNEKFRWDEDAAHE